MLKKISIIRFIAFMAVFSIQSTLLSGKELGSTKQKYIDYLMGGSKKIVLVSKSNSSLIGHTIDSIASHVKGERNKEINVSEATLLSRWGKYDAIIRKYLYKDYKKMYREKGGNFKYPFLTPGSSYSDQLWDWDSYFSDVALRQILLDHGTIKDSKKAVKYERGNVFNFLYKTGIDGWVPIVIQRDTIYKELMKGFLKPKDIYKENMHKPVLAQQVAFLVQMNNGNAEWFRNDFAKLQFFINNYRSHDRNRATGLYFWQTDHYIGVDTDPATFYRPPRSSASIFLNSFMYKELKAMVYLSKRLGFAVRALEYERDADELKQAIQKYCWDPRDGSFYSVDLDLLPINNQSWKLQSGSPRDYNSLIQRIDFWTNFLPMWAGIATPEQAKRIVKEHYENVKTFNAPFGVRTLSKMEKMYSLRASGNPSNWDGPIWGISNYLVWRGLVKYGYNKEAKKLAEKTVVLFGRDLQKTGTLHEYYDPENGEPILHPNFQDWNYLVLNMLDWLEHKPVISEF